MALIKSYIARDLVLPTCIALLIMLSIIWLMQSLRFLDLIINKGIGVIDFFNLTLLLLPPLVTVCIPLAFFAGCMFALKRLHDTYELPSLFNAGLSYTRIAAPFMLVCMVVVIINYGLSMYINPTSMAQFKELQFRMRNSDSHLLLEEGAFNNVSDTLMIYLKRRTSFNSFNTVLIHDTSTPEEPQTIIAESGEITTNTRGIPRLSLKNGIQQRISTDKTSMLKFEQYVLDIDQAVNNPTTRFRDREERYMHELINQPNLTPKQQKQFKAEVISRILWPLLPIPLLAIALISLLTEHHHRGGVGRQVFFGSVCGVIYFTLALTLQNMSYAGNPLILYGQIIPLCLAVLSVFITINMRNR